MAKRVKDGGTEEVILNAARKVFVKKGMYGARMQDIADEAGINKALLHYYFENKEVKQVSDTINLSYLKEFSLSSIFLIITLTVAQIGIKSNKENRVKVNLIGANVSSYKSIKI